MSGFFVTVGIAQLTLVSAFSAFAIVSAQEPSTDQNSSPAPTTTIQQNDSGQIEKHGPPPPSEGLPGGISLEDLLLQKGTITKDEWLRIRADQEYRTAEQTRRLDNLEDWKSKTEVLPILRDKVNIGLNSLQFLYGHVHAIVPEGRSQDSLSVRRAELVFWGKLSDYLPRWHMLMEFQNTGLTNNTPLSGSSSPTVATFFREAYIPISMFAQSKPEHPISTSSEWAFFVCPSASSLRRRAVLGISSARLI
ncbi:MAG: hypothetical protein U0236_03185 [Nitrospira sp.]